MFSMKKILRSATMLCIALVAMLLVGCGGSNPYGLNGVWTIGPHGHRALEFSGDTIIVDVAFSQWHSLGISLPREGTFSIRGDNRMEVLWSDGSHQVIAFTLTENALAPNQLHLMSNTFTFAE